MTLAVEGLRVVRAGQTHLHDVSLRVTGGEILAVIGANGAGKSTLLAAIAGEAPVAAGQVSLAGRTLAGYSRLERARRMAVLPQSHALTFPFAVHDVIALGRSPHVSGRAIDAAIVAEVAAAADVAPLLERPYTRLSGGEKQRVQLARVLAQVWRAEDAGERLLLLDEPVAALDIAHQGGIMRTLAVCAASGVAVVMVGHDISLAAAHADRLLALRAGRVVALGAPAEIVTEAGLFQIYGARTHVIAHPVTGTPVVLHD